MFRAPTHPADPEAPTFSLLRRRDEVLALGDYLIAELERDRALMDILDDPSVRALLDDREYLLCDLACDGLVREALEQQRRRLGLYETPAIPMSMPVTVSGLARQPALRQVA